MSHVRHSGETLTDSVAVEPFKVYVHVEPGKHKLVETRKAVEGGWRSIANRLAIEGQHDLANDVQRFVNRMSPVRTSGS